MHTINLADGGRRPDSWARITMKARQAMRNPDKLRVELQWVMTRGEFAEHANALRAGEHIPSMAHGLSLWQAVQDMHAEQRAEGERLQRERSVSDAPVCCDYSDCGRRATHEWARTHAEMKKMHRGGKKGIAVQPIVWHCEFHVPAWRTEQYVRLDERSERKAVA